MHVVLMGLRGSGKSTLARALSAATGRPFVDVDDRVAALLGCATPSEAWTVHGEFAFRATEVRALREAVGTPIIALGGGTPMAPGARAVLNTMKQSGATLVYLHADAAVLAERLRRDAGRPALLGTDPIAEIPAILAERDPVYRALADVVLDVAGLSVADAVRALTA